MAISTFKTDEAAARVEMADIIKFLKDEKNQEALANTIADTIEFLKDEENQKTLRDILQTILSYNEMLNGLTPEDKDNYGDTFVKDYESKPVDYYATTSMMFRRMCERGFYLMQEGAGEEVLFHGFPLKIWAKLMMLKFPKLEQRKDVINTVMFMLEDADIAEENTLQHNGIIGSVVCQTH